METFKHLYWQRLAASILLIGGLLGTNAWAHTPEDLRRSIDQASWHESNIVYRSIPVQQSTPILQSLAEKNQVMAQWFLADALARQGRYEDATFWLYTASLGTRMDSRICFHDNAPNVEGRFIHQFSARYERLRTNDGWRRQGLERAVAFHRNRLEGSHFTPWVCRLLQQEFGSALTNPWHSESYWLSMREKAFKDYQHQTGLDFSRTPDLYQMSR